MKRVSVHAKQRFHERANLDNKSERVKTFALAVKHGKVPEQYVAPFCDFLLYLKRGKNIKVKVYKDYIYIYKNKTLITLFTVPEKYLPTEQYLKKGGYYEVDEYANIKRGTDEDI